ncbi:MAG: hypothetical protein ACTSYL_08720 [Candidatus Thorarchaeota archaeon]
METGIASISTTVYINGTPSNTEIHWTMKGPILKNNHTITEDIYYIMKEKIIPISGGASKSVPLNEPVPIYLKPEFMVWRPYVKQSNRPDTMYPASTEGWVRRMIDRTQRGMYVVQKIKNSQDYWLTILDRHNNIHEAHRIEAHETPIIELKEDWESVIEFWQRLLTTNPQNKYRDLVKLLNSPPPSWKELSTLVIQADIENITIKENMLQTLDQLVPKSFPQDTRIEIMAFLAWTIRGKILEKDPIKFYYNLANTHWFRSLGIMHLQCLLENQSPPPYVKILQEAEQRIATFSYLTRDHSLSNKIELLILDKAEQYIPDYRGYAFKYMRNIGRREKVRVTPPISKAEAKSSMLLKKTRLALLYKGLTLKTTINPQAVGLTALLSLSPAYRWPHKHMAWSANVAGAVKNLQYIQYIVVPPSVVEILNRAIGNVVEIEWNAKRISRTLFRPKAGKWTTRRSWIEQSVRQNSSLTQLRREFGGWDGHSVSSLTREEAMIIDMTTSNFFQFLTELDSFESAYGITKDRLEEVLDDLHKRNAIGILYRCMLWQLASIVFDIVGVPERVYSTVRGLMKHTPSALGMINKNGEHAIVITKIPFDDLHYYLYQFPTIALNDDITIKTARVTEFRSYQNTLLQRLLRPDGSWDDDISMLLRQSHEHRRFRKI